MNDKNFARKILPLSDQLYRFALSILKDSENAKDCVQDLFVKMIEKDRRWEEMDNPKSFLMFVLRNQCIDRLRTTKSHESTDLELVNHAPNPHQKMEQKESMRMIKQYIGTLPEIQRTIIHLRDIEGLEIAEITEIVSMTENAVYVNLSRARQKIREKLNYLNNK
ncbi:sigma-70 family RNA polymerase sigma factor [Bacteroidales bacterium OttesenSCG-928-B11]|nr:sigma-70 family RNA polymerase sigma factor [Bacteroidales bacterium OttesenSCG-928-E04]MDL2308512.1 sigma-70 family RNA polymerase sigma factor [Bacteroidales bacterium OttesenSCG-928-C03]MDL2311404.1 sigma-70 family RNA polymerase sigma factor [Bacteroidales bacterium OttesenSCG-928-B11]MDL2325799.1 sigma-70 family RNA polymerase sigma factor [Bacteroidales bacterium OttesenSCG-928-A14]